MRAIEITLGTIVIMVILLATLLAILFFFQGGFELIGEGIAGIAKSAKEGAYKTDTDPTNWGIGCQEACCDDGADDTCSITPTYRSLTECNFDCESPNKCWCIK